MIFSIRDYLIIIISLILPSKLKILFYRLIGYKIGKNVKIGLFSAISVNQASLGNHVEIDKFTIIKCNQLTIKDYSRISMFNLIYGYSNLNIGIYCYIGEKTTINLDDNIEMGDHSAIGPRCSLYTHGVWLPYSEGHPRKFAPIKIGKEVRIICNNVIQPGVEIGNYSMVAPNSVVVKSIPENEFVSGVPAVKIKSVSEIKTKINEAELKKRLKEMIDSYKEIFSAKEDMVIYPNQPNNKNFIVLLWSKDQIINNGSWLNFKTRKCHLKTKEAKIFKTYLWEKYGEWFIDV